MYKKSNYTSCFSITKKILENRIKDLCLFASQSLKILEKRVKEYFASQTELKTFEGVSK